MCIKHFLITLSFLGLFNACKTPSKKVDHMTFQESFTGYDMLGNEDWCWKPKTALKCGEEDPTIKEFKEKCTKNKDTEFFQCGCSHYLCAINILL